MQKSTLIKAFLLGLSSFLILIFFSRILAPDSFYSYEAKTYDWRVVQGIEKGQGDISLVTIIDVDDRAFEKLGSFYRWPKDFWVDVFKYVSSGDPSAMVVDVIFDPNKFDESENELFVNGVRDAGKIYNALYFGSVDSSKWRYKMKTEPPGLQWEKIVIDDFPQKILKQYPVMDRMENKFIELINAGKSAGHANFDPDIDGEIRYIPLGRNFNGKFYPAISFKAVYDVVGGEKVTYNDTTGYLNITGSKKSLEIPVDDQGRMLIRYQGDYKVFRNISFYDVLKKRVPKEVFKDKIVIFGTSLAGLFDLRVTPISPKFPGVAVHANILYDMMTGSYYTKLSDFNALLITLLMALFFAFIFTRIRPVQGIILALILIIVYLVVVFLIFEFESLWVPIIEPSFVVLIVFGVTFSYRFITEEKNKRFLRGVFSHYVTPSVVDELLENPDKIKLGGERKICTVLFSDVQGFTTVSEKMEPEELVQLLNEYLTAMTDIVFKYEGMLDKYEGDAIMAVFGAPVEHENDAFNACRCALDMQDKLSELREKWEKEGKPPLKARVGLNTGPMVVGNMGSESRFDYTVMGDSVNLGARLEPANKEYGTYVMMGETSYQKVKDLILARKLDLLRVKGKEEPVGVYEVMAVLENAENVRVQLVELFDTGYTAYLEQQWDRAEEYFKMALRLDPKDGPSKTYLKRVKLFRENPPGEEWDGVFTMTTK